jgi:hypothetical protein
MPVTRAAAISAKELRTNHCRLCAFTALAASLGERIDRRGVGSAGGLARSPDVFDPRTPLALRASALGRESEYDRGRRGVVLSTP